MMFLPEDLNACRNWIEAIRFEMDAIGDSGALMAKEIEETRRDIRQIDIVFDGIIECAKEIEGLRLRFEEMCKNYVRWNYYADEYEIRMKKYEEGVASVDDSSPPIQIYNDCPG